MERSLRGGVVVAKVCKKGALVRPNPDIGDLRSTVFLLGLMGPSRRLIEKHSSSE